MDNEVKHEGYKVPITQHFSTYVVGVTELMKALGLEGKSSRDLLRHGIPQEQIVTVPIAKNKTKYLLKREGIEAFIKKYKPEDLESFMQNFDKIVAEVKETSVRKKKLEEGTDPYSVDLLEDILHKINGMYDEEKRFHNATMTMYSRQMVFMLEMEALYSKTAALLLRAESLGPIARINKELTKDLVALSKELFSDALLCEQTLKEYEEFGKDEEVNENDKDRHNSGSKTSGLLIRTNKEGQNN